METLKDIWSNIVAYAQEGYNFLQEGNYMYYFIAAVAAVFLLIIAIIVLIVAKRKKKKAKKAAEESAYYNASEDDLSAEANKTPETIEETLAPFADHGDALEPTEEVVQPESDSLSEVKAEEIEPENIMQETVEEVAEPEIVRSVVVTPTAYAKADSIEEDEDDEVVEEDASVEDAKAAKGKRTLSGYVQIYKDKGGKFRFRIKSSNKGIVAHSQGYTTKSACKNGIKAVANASETAPTVDTTKSDYVVTIGKAAFEIFRDKNGKFYFRLRAANTSNVLSSQGYSSKASCINGIESVKFLSVNHTLIDDTKLPKA